MSTKTPSAVVSFNAVPEDAADPDVKIYVNGELVESGGGSSDITTATVKLSNDSSSGYISMPLCYDLEGYTGLYGLGPVAADGEYTVALYKGAAYINVITGTDVLSVVSGDAELDENAIKVTGDCVIKYLQGGN